MSKVENTYQEVFNENCALSEDECVMAIWQASNNELTLKEAQAEYRTLATVEGLIKSPSTKKEEFNEAVETLNMDNKDDVNAARAIGSELEIGVQTVTRYLKAKAVADGVTLAITVANRSNSMSAQLKSWFMENTGASSDEIVEKAIELGMTETSAKYYVPIYSTALEIAQVIANQE